MHPAKVEKRAMPVTITDDMLMAAGLSESEARLEIACRLYAAGKLSLPEATRWAGASRTRFEAALLERSLPLVRIDDEYWKQEAGGMRRLGW
jgi:predicted HTH domain antitoxin